MNGIIIMIIANEVSDIIDETSLLTDVKVAKDEGNQEEVERITLESEKYVLQGIAEVVNTEEEFRIQYEEVEGQAPTDEEVAEAMAERDRIIGEFLNVHYTMFGSEMRIGDDLTVEQVEARNGGTK